MTTPLPDQRTARSRVENDLFIGPADYAALMPCSLNVVYAGLHSGAIPAVRLGQRFRIPSAWVRQQAGL